MSSGHKNNQPKKAAPYFKIGNHKIIMSLRLHSSLESFPMTWHWPQLFGH